MSYRALLLRNQPEFSARIETLDDADLPEGDVELRIDYSTLNYKDALALGNTSPIVRAWPMVAGIDAAGTVTASTHTGFQPGDAVVLNGWGLGETRWGGLAEKTRAPGDWLVKLPPPLTPRDAAGIGTAGYTAAMCVQALERHGLTPADGPLLVTGATGGVGSIAVMLLARAGFEVVAVSGKVDAADYLRRLGAAEVLARAELATPGKPLQKETYAGVVDTLGSHALANACARVRRNGAVAACGLAMGMDFPATVAPFILRGVTLYGIDSVYADIGRRRAAWDLLAARLTASDLTGITREIGLEECVPAAAGLRAGTMTGRYLVDLRR
jgi:acrylyl-CoA reductase (NADPH)